MSTPPNALCHFPSESKMVQIHLILTICCVISSISVHGGADEADSDERESPFAYSSDLIPIIGKPVEGLRSVSGPVMSLDESGKCQFIPASFYNSGQADEYWQFIAAGYSRGLIDSKYILLPNHWDGLIIAIELRAKDDDEFEILLSSPTVDHNSNIKLPQLINMRLEMILSNGDRYSSKTIQFEVKKLQDYAASLEDFLIPLKNVNRSELPQIYFQFLE